MDDSRNGRSPSLRLLLVEFVRNERWLYESRHFPFLKGLAEALGGEARWVCFGAPIRVAKTGEAHVSHYVDLEEDDRRTLAHHVAAVEPTHVIVSQPITARVLREVTRGSAAVKVLCTSEHEALPEIARLHTMVGAGGDDDLGRPGSPDRSPDIEDRKRLGGSVAAWRLGRTDWFLAWVGHGQQSSYAGRYLVGAADPSFAAVMANPAARAVRPHVLIPGGVVCDHFALIEDNPLYQGIDLSVCTTKRGCAYCPDTWYRGPTSDLRDDPIAVVRGHLQRVLETGLEGRYCGFIDFLDVRLFRRIDELAEVLAELGFPPTTFGFETRVDRVLNAVPQLEQALPRFRQEGHTLWLYRMGAENLVEEENALFNKHIRLQQLDDGRAVMSALAQRFAGTFSFDPTWGYITCSPWTTLDMLSLGITRAIERGFEPCGVWLFTPLWLGAGAPITRRAEVEGGILTPAFDDASFIYWAVVNNLPISTARPWRFKDPRTGDALALIVRFCCAALRNKHPDTLFQGDALYEQILAAEPEFGPFDRCDMFAVAVIAAVRAAFPAVPPPGSVADRPSLLRTALATYRATAHRTSAGGEPAPAAPAPLSASAAPSLGHHDPRARRMYQVLEAARRHVERAGGLSLRINDVTSGRDAGEFHLTLTMDSVPYDLVIFGGDPARPAFLRVGAWGVRHGAATPLRDPSHTRALVRWLTLAHRAAHQHAPELVSS